MYIYATITANFCVRGNCERKEHPYILHINLLYMYNRHDRIQTVRENAAEGCSLCLDIMLRQSGCLENTFGNAWFPEVICNRHNTE